MRRSTGKPVGPQVGRAATFLRRIFRCRISGRRVHRRQGFDGRADTTSVGSRARDCRLEGAAGISPPLGDLLHGAAAVFSNRTGSDSSGLRVERLMSLIGAVSNDRPLVEIYDLVAHAEPNELRSLNADLRARVATDNMDRLREAADPGGPNVLHLHGDFDHQEQISTTIDQYLTGVPGSLGKPFLGMIAGKRVLVVGWGARDIDIVELFLRCQPSALHFIVRER